MTRIARQPDKKGARSTARDQAVFEKSSFGTNSAQNADKDNHAENIPQRGPDQAQQQRLIQTRNKWTREEYKKVIEAYYTALNHPTTSITTAAYKAKKLFSVHREAKKFRRELNLPAVEKTSANEPSTNYARRTKVKAKQQAQEQLKNNWEEKPLHGKYPRRLNDNDVDQAQTNKWLKTSGLKSETEGFIIAAQDQCIKTNYYRNKILKDGCNPMCRICSQHLETIDHVVSGCPELAKTEYIHRHNKAAMYIHWKLCKYYDIDVTERYYKHEPTTVTENDQVTILWDMPIQTDREITANRPDIVVKDKVNKTCLLIDMSVPTERNISIKTMEKLSKYKDLEIEIERMWGLKATTVPVIIGALGLIKKGLDNFINRIPGNIKVIELQKIVLLDTAHILRRTLSYK